MSNIDDLDTELLAALDADPRAGIRELASQLGVARNIKQSSLVAGYVDSQAFSSSFVDVDGFEFAALDLVQHGLPGNSEGFRGVGEPQPAFWAPRL